MVFVLVGHELTPVAARQDAHATAFFRCRRQRQPHGDKIVRIQSPITQVLVPGYERAALRFLHPKQCVPAENIRADEIFHRVQNGRSSHQLVDPGEKQMRLIAKCSPDRSALLGFKLLKLPTRRGHLALVENSDRKIVTLLAVLR